MDDMVVLELNNNNNNNRIEYDQQEFLVTLYKYKYILSNFTDEIRKTDVRKHNEFSDLLLRCLFFVPLEAHVLSDYGVIQFIENRDYSTFPFLRNIHKDNRFIFTFLLFSKSLLLYSYVCRSETYSEIRIL